MKDDVTAGRNRSTSERPGLTGSVAGASRDGEVTLVGALRRAPVRTALLTVLPLCLGVAQVANGALTPMDPAVALAFAAVMVAYAVVSTRYQLARDRLAVLEASASAPTAD